ncbi:exopolysaccharide biosynthesis polyprenyl glycosylphosphotransferase [Falsiroseomonas sp. HW251]|uniref:exopolysaccharide biosynthesis polyprenyl glycosylphosphotransferase n=1 Tax=Falsiroseomonas sp. HW251 TaxID=3390998 RepID=UPI003D315A4E
MRAATPKADQNLRPEGGLPQPGTARLDTVHGLPAPELAGVTPLRPGRQDGATIPLPAANDARRALPRPLPPTLLSAAVVAIDILAMLTASFAADQFSGVSGGPHGRITLLIVALTFAIGLASGAYDHPVLFSGRRQARAVGAAALSALAITIGSAAAFGVLWRLDATWLAMAVALGAVGLAGARVVMAACLRGTPRAARRAVILGAGPQADRLADALRRERTGLELLGLFDERGLRGLQPPDGLPSLGGMPQLLAMVRRGEVDVVIIALPWSEERRAEALIGQLSACPVEVRLAPDLIAMRMPDDGRPPVPPLMLAVPIAGWRAAVKAVSDYMFAGIALAVAALPMLAIAVAVKLDSPGPVLFRQRRTGFNDRHFDVYKFRTMYADATDHQAQRQVLPGDPRVTRVGRVLRRASLDELPQLFNVLRGEMSFVGPRPHAPGTLAGNRRFDEVVANYAARHRVKPGLTGLAQVRGLRGPTPTERQILLRVESDLEYIANWSPWLDIAIVLRTLLVVVRMRNAL